MKLQKHKIIYVDIDGTICRTPYIYTTGSNQYELAEPIHERIHSINELFDEGHTIVYWTARGAGSEDNYEDLTRNQLLQWGAKFTKLLCGHKPHFDLYICDKSWNSESFFQYKEHGLP
jgi:phosphatidate phosphatase PAH1|tara:strand:- start:1223 stop:1576 length:354 start_codon:yes stop_codon:yes gene_type:complete